MSVGFSFFEIRYSGLKYIRAFCVKRGGRDRNSISDWLHNCQNIYHRDMAKTDNRPSIFLVPIPMAK
jgi:hypothetical protein